MTLKRKIKAERLKRGWTQNKLASLLGVKQFTISDYETGRLEPNIRMLIKLADAFKISVDELLSHKVKQDNTLSDEIQKEVNRQTLYTDIRINLELLELCTRLSIESQEKTDEVIKYLNKLLIDK